MRFKVPSGLYGKATDKKMLNEVVYFLQCKMLFPTYGSIRANALHSTMKSVASRSKSYDMMRKLLKHNLVIKNKGRYCLVSFDQFCTILGFASGSDRNTRNRATRGTYKVHRIPMKLVPIKLIKEFLATIELKDNCKSQIRAAYLKLKHDQRFKYNEPARRKKGLGLKDMVSHIDTATEDLDTVQMIKDNHYSMELEEYAEAHGTRDIRRVNPDIAISCKGLANRLGVCTTTAWNILSRLKALGWISWNRRFVFHSLYCPVLSEGYDDKLLYRHDDALYYKLPNSIQVFNWQRVAYSFKTSSL